nr:ribonuclease III domain-containing protein [uncultured Methanoregula sp.]
MAGEDSFPGDPKLSKEDLEQYVGYNFINRKILDDALTRRSYCNETKDNEYEFMNGLGTLGDAVLDTAVIFHSYQSGKHNPQELNDERVRNINRQKTADFAKKHELHRYVLWGKGESKQKSWEREKSGDTITEALIGAIFYDAQTHGNNGLAIVMDLLMRLQFFQED